MPAKKSYPPVYFGSYVGGQLVNPSADALTDDCNAKLQREFMACIDATPHTTKPPKTQIPVVSKALDKCEFKPYTLAELAAALSMGCTVLPAYCEGGRKLENWKAQQLWFVDIDNDPDSAERGYEPLGYTYAVERCNMWGLPLVMSYESFSSSAADNPDPAAQRYRLVFAQDDVITDKAKAAGFGEALLSAFPECDRTTTQPNRLFFGTDKEVNVWFKPIFPL